MRGQPCLAAIWRPTRGPLFVKLAVERLYHRDSTQAARKELGSPAGRIHSNVPSWSHVHASPPTLEPHTPRLAAHLQSPVPANPGRTLRDVEITSSSYTTQLNPKYPSFINCPLPCFLAETASRRHSYHTFSHRKFISFATTLQLAILQYCTSTRRPANLEISVLPSPHLSIIPTLRQPCRRSPFSSLRTHGRAQQPLNEYVIAILALDCIDIWRTF